MSANAYLDACGWLPTSGGTGTWTVATAIPGYQTLAAAATAQGVASGAILSYRAESADKSQWEEGFGASGSSNTTLARSTITANSSGGTTAINFSSAPNVFITAASADLQNASLLTSGTLIAARLGGLSGITASLGADVAMNNTANYFDGPSIAQGSSGIWLVFGKVTVLDTAGASDIYAKLWDGTTVPVIDSGYTNVFGAFSGSTIALSGVISAPVGNLRISCRDTTRTTGLIKFNSSGNSRDSTITAIRIG